MSGLKFLLVSCVGHTKSHITTLPCFFSKSAKFFILKLCLILPSGEKSQSFAISLTMSALYQAALSIGCIRFARYVFPLPGNPITSIFIILP